MTDYVSLPLNQAREAHKLAVKERMTTKAPKVQKRSSFRGPTFQQRPG